MRAADLRRPRYAYAALLLAVLAVAVIVFGTGLHVSSEQRAPAGMSPASGSPTSVTGASHNGSATARPNFVVILLDDTRTDGIDRMERVRSRLAAEGVTFRNAFVTDASCASSRASILSGRYALHHGTRGVSGPIGGAHTFRESGADRQTIAVWLRSAGYRTGLFGKYLNDYAATEAKQGPGGGFYVPPGWDRWRAMVSPEHYGGIHGPTYALVDEGGQRASYDNHATDEQYSTDLLAGEVRRFISDSVTAGEPFCALWTPYASHGESGDFLPRPAARHFDAFHGLPGFRPPNWNEDDASDKPRYVASRTVSPFLPGLNYVVRQRAYETLLAVDEQVGLILDQLVELGVDANTFVLLTSDNGVAWGEHRFFTQTKGCPYEECLRVPLIVRAPRLTRRPATVVDAAVLNIDLAPTIAALAQVPIPVAVDGVSFADWLTGTPAKPRRQFLLEHWREARDDMLGFAGQVSDADTLRLFHGDPTARPRAVTVFEVDSGDGLTHPGAVAVSLGADGAASFAHLADSVTHHIGATATSLNAKKSQLTVLDRSPAHHGVYWMVDADQGGVLRRTYPMPDYFGVRDVARGYTYVEYETGEVELYDLNADPYQLDNKAADPGSATMRADLAAALAELLR